jgi:hypothetical protein
VTRPSTGVRRLAAAFVVGVLGAMCLVAAAVSESSAADPPAPGSTLAPGFAVAFVPSTVRAGDIAVLKFTIDNTKVPVDAGELTFTDMLPPGITVAPVPSREATQGSAPTTTVTTVTSAAVPGVTLVPEAPPSCPSGTLDAQSGTSSIARAGATVAASASCVVTVPVQTSTAGTYSTTPSALSSSAGTSSVTAPASLTVAAVDAVASAPAPAAKPRSSAASRPAHTTANAHTEATTTSAAGAAPPAFSVAFDATAVDPGQSSTLRFTIAATDAIQGVAVTSNLEGGLTVADPAAPTSDGCGTTEAASPTSTDPSSPTSGWNPQVGATTLAFNDGKIAAGTTCTLTVSVTAPARPTAYVAAASLTYQTGQSNVPATTEPGLTVGSQSGTTGSTSTGGSSTGSTTPGVTGVLATTGSRVITLTITGVVLLAVGIGLVVAASPRRRRSPARC